MAAGITIIAEKQGRELLDRGYETGKYEPRGKFLMRMGWLKWAAIDNSTGDAWMEIFRTKHRAIRWLNGGREKSIEGWWV